MIDRAVSCGCDHHGDHLGCDARCKEYGGGCQHPLGVEITAATEEEANRRSGLPLSDDEKHERAVAIQRGDTPAHTIPQLVDAIRQNLAGAGADCGTAKIAFGRGDIEAGNAALQRLCNHLIGIGRKTDLAFEEALRDA